MIFQKRWYQEECADALFKRVTSGPGVHPIAAVPTAGGKSFILALFIDRLISAFPNEEILILSHVQEIIQQDYDELRKYFEWDEESEDYIAFTNFGIYSSGLKRKEIKKITVASIQSVWRKPEKFKHFKHVVIDECHLIGMEEDSMYRSFLSKIEATNFSGLTATPYRTGYGYLYKGEDALFNELCYDLTSRENFNRLTDEGYLCRLYSKRTKLRLDPKGIKMQGGDYNQKQMSKKFDRDEITRQAILETIEFGKEYKRWLFFCIDVKHAENTARILNDNGVKAICIHSKSDGERSELIEASKSGEYRAVVTVKMLTTGYNDPRIDLIAILCPSVSPIFHVQGIGRGLRCMYADGYDLNTIEGRLAAQKEIKPHTLVLDYAGNSRRLGPINDVYIKQKEDDEGGGGGPMVKYCEACEMENHLSARVCVYCGEEFQIKEKLTAQAEQDYEVVARSDKEAKPPKQKTPDEPTWFEIEEVQPQILKGNADQQDIFILTHTTTCGRKIQEKVDLDGNGYARHFAKFWVREHLRKDVKIPESLIPDSVQDLYDNLAMLEFPACIEVDFKKSAKWPHVKSRKFVQ